MRAKPPSCETCPARDWGVGFVPPSGPKAATIAFIGQGPGQQEAEFDQPFHDRAPAGWRLRHWIQQVDHPNLRERNVTFANVVWCWLPEGSRGGVPYGNRAPTPDEIQFCTSRHLVPWLATLPNLERVVPVGVPAAGYFLGPERAKDKYLGTTTQVEIPDASE